MFDAIFQGSRRVRKGFRWWNNYFHNNGPNCNLIGSDKTRFNIKLDKPSFFFFFFEIKCHFIKKKYVQHTLVNDNYKSITR